MTSNFGKTWKSVISHIVPLKISCLHSAMSGFTCGFDGKNILEVIIIIVIYVGTVDITGNGRRHLTGPERTLRIRDILPDTIVLKQNDRKIVSFSIKGSSANYNIKFKTEKQASYFIGPKVTRYYAFILRYFHRKTSSPKFPTIVFSRFSDPTYIITFCDPLGENIFKYATGHHSLRQIRYWRSRL